MQVRAPPNQPQWHSHCQAAAWEISVTSTAAPERKSQMSGTSCCGECHIAGGWRKALRVCPPGQDARTRHRWHPAAPPKRMPPEASACRRPVPCPSLPLATSSRQNPVYKLTQKKSNKLLGYSWRGFFFLNTFLSLPICCWIWDKGW